jgi:hypothetical protein
LDAGFIHPAETIAAYGVTRGVVKEEEHVSQAVASVGPHKK